MSSPHRNETNNALSSIISDICSPNGEPASKKQRYVHLTTDQFDRLIAVFQQSVTNANAGNNAPSHPSPTSVAQTTRSSPTSTRLPEYYNNAKYEDISTKPLTKKYDGSAEGLIPFLNRLDIRRQDEGWYDATFVIQDGVKLDLTRHFVRVLEATVVADAKARWTAETVLVDRHTVGHPTYNARLLGKVLLNSITDNVSTTVINRVPQDYRNDGPLILWTICYSIHRNHVAFVETVKKKIRELKLSECHDDVIQYIILVKNDIRLICSATDDTQEHNDLLTYIFTQLLLSTVLPFKNEILKWQLLYLEGKDLDLTPTKLLDKAEDQVRVLKHAHQWIEATADTSIMTLKAMIEKNQQDAATVFQAIAANIGEFTQRQQDFNHRLHGQRLRDARPSWLSIAPVHSEETKVWNNKTYVWCSRCRRGEGLWVCSHTTETHQEGYRQAPRDSSQSYRHDRSRRPDFEYRPRYNDYNNHSQPGNLSSDPRNPQLGRSAANRSPSPARNRSVTFQDRSFSSRPQTQSSARAPQAKLSLMDAIAAFAGRTEATSDED